MRYFACIGALLLSGCTTDGQGYTSISGRTNPQRMRLALAECQGEASATPQAFYLYTGGMVGLAGTLAARAVQEQSVTSGCMARYGYVAAQPKAQPQ
jgi:hypothetical protein